MQLIVYQCFLFIRCHEPLSAERPSGILFRTIFRTMAAYKAIATMVAKHQEELQAQKAAEKSEIESLAQAIEAAGSGGDATASGNSKVEGEKEVQIQSEAAGANENNAGLAIVPFVEKTQQQVPDYEGTEALPQPCKYTGCEFIGTS